MTQNESRSIFDAVPAHIRYPGMVVLFLGGTILAQVSLVRAAISDGGAQIEENYYDRAVAWDEQQEALRASDALGWKVSLSQPTSTSVDVIFKDKHGAPVILKDGEFTVRRPHLSQPLGTQNSIKAAGHGTYTIDLPGGLRDGLWDFDLHVRDTRGNAFQKTLRASW